MLYLALIGGEIIDPQYMPYVTLTVLVLNVWMRPRPAVISSDGSIFKISQFNWLNLHTFYPIKNQDIVQKLAQQNNN